jgi:hypothetical protein
MAQPDRRAAAAGEFIGKDVFKVFPTAVRQHITNTTNSISKFSSKLELIST